MIEIEEKSKCCGCSACVQRCPKQCITLQEDTEGFLYPKVDESVCIDCGLCEKVCPVINQSAEREPLAVYAAKNPDEDIRMQSSSGGVFTLLAEKVLDEGGVVFGACFNERWEVVHDFVETKEELKKFRGSKYVQSKVGETFLKQGREVLYSGTPCQIAGLKLYLRKNYDNLLAVDFICHGVPSPGVFRTYLQTEINRRAARKGGKNTVLLPSIPLISERDGLDLHGMSIKSISFRDKRKGWKKFGFALTLSEASAEGENSVLLSYEPLNKNLFMRGFLHNIYLRPSCYSCPAKCLKSGSDVTLADFWGIGRLNRKLDDDKGISLVLVNSLYAQSLCQNLLSCKRTYSMNEVYKFNPAIRESCKEPSKRKMFFESRKPLNSTIKILTKPTLKERMREVLVSMAKMFLRRK